jgi:hypothetical protein
MTLRISSSEKPVRAPGPHRLQLDLDQPCDAVGVRTIGIEVLPGRRLGHRDLQRIVALDQARHVDMAAIGALQDVALPQQAVGMHVDG